MRAALARAAARLFPRDRVDPAGWQLRDRLLPAGEPPTTHDGGDRALARLSTKALRPAASELAHDRLAARQPMVRKRGLARTARPGGRGAVGAPCIGQPVTYIGLYVIMSINK